MRVRNAGQRDEARLEGRLPAERHSELGRRHAGGAPQQFHQVFGVLDGRCPGPEYRRVARLLPGEAKAPRYPPGTGMEPVHGADELHEQLHGTVLPLDVRHLVNQHGPAAAGCPDIAGRWKHDGRPMNPDRERNRRGLGDKQTWCGCPTEHVGGLGK